MTNPTDDQTQNLPFGPQTLVRAHEESLVRADVLRGFVAEETERLRKLRLSQTSVEDLVRVLATAQKSPKSFGEGVRSLRDGIAAYFFAVDNDDGVARGFFKWEDSPNCRPSRLFHASAIGQVPGLAGNIRAVVLTPAGAGQAVAQEYLVHFEAAPGISYPYASRHGTPVEVPLDAFELVSD